MSLELSGSGITFTNTNLPCITANSYFCWNYVPENTVYEDEEKKTIKMALPGLKKKEVDITVTKDVLTISYEGNGDFVKAFGCDFDVTGYLATEAKVSLVNGVLEIEMEVKESYKPKKLKI